MEKVKKNKVVKSWINRHINDHYVNMAQKDSYRSRAAYKLLDIDAEVPIFKNINVIVDLGCSPGSWSQIALQKIIPSGKIVSVDLLEMQPIAGVEFILGDFTEQDTLTKLVSSLSGSIVDLVISDMSPNLSGIRMVDQARSSYLVELVLDFSKEYLRLGGNCIIKVFQGSEFNNILAKARKIFVKVVIHKPKASRSDSSEIYLLCMDKKKL